VILVKDEYSIKHIWRNTYLTYE